MLPELIKTAMLGTERSFPQKENLPNFLHPAYERIMSSDATREDKYLKISALFFQIHQTSSKDIVFTEKINIAPLEEKAYISEKASRLLRQYLKKDDKLMILFALKCFEKVEKIVPPYLVPTLLDKAYTRMEWRALIAKSTGNRAVWLSQFDKRWQNVLDLEANNEKLAKKSEKVKISKEEETFRALNKIEQYALLEEMTKNDIGFYQYLKMLMTEDFVRFPQDFSQKIYAEFQKRYCSQGKEFYQNIALHLHSSLKSDLMEQTNQSYNSVGLFPNTAREMLEILMDRDDLL
jgi:Family of unknown function (DUF5691)